MPVLTADGERLGAITEGEAVARNLTAGAGLALNRHGELVVTSVRARVYWPSRSSLLATVQPAGWSGGRHPDARGS